jgi:hypothetical protein
LQSDALAASNSTVCRRLASPPRKNRSNSPGHQQQQQQQQQRNNTITIMNLQSPLATEDWQTLYWQRGARQKQIDFLDVAAEGSDGDGRGGGGGGGGDDDGDVGLRVSASGMRPW